MMRSIVFVSAIVAVFMIGLSFAFSGCPKAASSTWHKSTDLNGNMTKTRIEDGQQAEVMLFDKDGHLLRHSYRDWTSTIHVVEYDPTTGEQISHTTQ